jgi:Protein of unknown function (DUF2892)
LIKVFGTDWCSDTRRTLRHLRRLHVPHQYINIDDSLDGLARAKQLTDATRCTPIVDLAMGGQALVEPANDTLTGALVELAMLTQDEACDRLAVQNVGDIERAVRMSAGAALLASVRAMPGRGRWPVAVIGIFGVVTGLTGWCPAYHRAGVSSLDGPGDRPGEAEGNTWISRRSTSQVRLMTAGTRV